MTPLSNRFYSVAGGAALIACTLVPTPAQSYPIDCAILLCLAGGWPASAPCARARFEFIRRITPWPIEPPLQIWRCPMSMSYDGKHSTLDADRLYEILMENDAPLQSLPTWPTSGGTKQTFPAILRRAGNEEPHDSTNALENVNGADIDISGPAFDFIRSIRVFNIYAQTRETRSDCVGESYIQLGTYGAQGNFSWRKSDISVPSAYTGFEAFKYRCGVTVRSVFIDWRDYQGNYGFEQVDY